MRVGTAGWIGLAAYVAGWDWFASEELSTAFGRALAHPVRRWPVIVAWTVTTAHLFRLIPRRWDPFHALGRLRPPPTGGRQ